MSTVCDSVATHHHAVKYVTAKVRLLRKFGSTLTQCCALVRQARPTWQLVRLTAPVLRLAKAACSLMCVICAAQVAHLPPVLLTVHTATCPALLMEGKCLQHLTRRVAQLREHTSTNQHAHNFNVISSHKLI